jgi:hypothetical protein
VSCVSDFGIVLVRTESKIFLSTTLSPLLIQDHPYASSGDSLTVFRSPAFMPTIAFQKPEIVPPPSFTVRTRGS